MTADNMFAHYQQERPSNELSQIYDALSKDLEQILDSDFFNENTACILRNIRDNWNVSKLRFCLSDFDLQGIAPLVGGVQVSEGEEGL